MKLTEKQGQLLLFVMGHHADQRRKYTHDPYFFHLYAVAELVQPVEERTGKKLLVEIALCHDLFEDTKCKEHELIEFLHSIGYYSAEVRYIVYGVVALTDEFTSEEYPKMNRFKRKAAERERLEKINADYQTVKYADMINNTSSIVNYDPSFAKTYMQEKYQILAVMTLGDPVLYDQCANIVQSFINSTDQ